MKKAGLILGCLLFIILGFSQTTVVTGYDLSTTTGDISSNVTGTLTGDSYGTHYGDVIGDLTGNVTIDSVLNIKASASLLGLPSDGDIQLYNDTLRIYTTTNGWEKLF